MKIDKIARLFSTAKNHSASNQNNIAKVAASKPAATAQPSDAVKVELGRNRPANNDSRTERVRELAEQVKTGSYNPDTEKVAEAVARELLP